MVAGFCRIATMTLVVFLLIADTTRSALLSTSAADGGASIYFCKCICFSNYTILPLYRPADPSKPCLSCTKQFCLDQQLPICKDASKGATDLDTATGEEGDIQTKCFQRDSALSYSVVVIFVAVTSVLLVGAVLKQKMGDDFQQYTPLAVVERFRRGPSFARRRDGR